MDKVKEKENLLIREAIEVAKKANQGFKVEAEVDGMPTMAGLEDQVIESITAEINKENKELEA